MTMLTHGADPTDVMSRRIMAWIADAFITYGVLVLIGAALGLWSEMGVAAEEGNLVNGGTLALFLIGALVWALIKMVLIATYGWTPGKLLFGLRIVGWDGRPPSLGKAFLRSAFFGVGEGLFGCFYDLPALACAMGTAGHRQPADLIASTYVIDAVYLGRLIMRHDKRVSAGPESVTADEMATFVKQQTGVSPPPGKKITEPFYDKGRDTYVVFNTKRDEWLQFDKAANEWISLR